MGCGASLTARTRVTTVPADENGVLVRESYEKCLMSPGGTVTKVLGHCIDTTLPRKTPGGSAAARRDYDRDPLTFEEVRAIEAARERARYLAETPKMLATSWRKIVLQAPEARTPASRGEPSESARSAESERTGSGRREIRVPLVRPQYLIPQSWMLPCLT